MTVSADAPQTSPQVPLSKRLKWRVEQLATRAFLGIFAALPVDKASALGGALFRLIGPRIKAHKIAKRNLQKILPQKTEAEQAVILRRMWDNLGRTIGELPHLSTICDPASGRVEVVGEEHLIEARDDEIGGLFFSAHFSNWEITPWTAFRHYGQVSHPFYRAPNNPLMDDLFNTLRRGSGGEPLPKGRKGARRAVVLLKKGEHLAFLVDQKMNDGIEVPFMGHPAMTASALATFALKFNLPVIPIHNVRLGGARFRLIVEPKLTYQQTGQTDADSLALMAQVNDTIGQWIEDAPEQWLWVHRRWK